MKLLAMSRTAIAALFRIDLAPWARFDLEPPTGDLCMFCHGKGKQYTPATAECSDCHGTGLETGHPTIAALRAKALAQFMRSN